MDVVIPGGSASTHRRQKRNLIARGNARIPRREFLIPRNHHRVAKPRQLREAFGIALKHLRQGRSGRQFTSLLSQPGQFPHPPKEHHLHPQTRPRRWHPKIVTCPPSPRHPTPPTRHLAYVGAALRRPLSFLFPLRGTHVPPITQHAPQFPNCEIIKPPKRTP